MKKILIIIDMQNDFITGDLSVENGLDVVHRITDQIDSSYDSIILTQDTHFDFGDDYYNTIEGSNLPSHCVYLSDGWKIVDDIVKEINDWRIPYVTVSKETFGSISVLPEAIERNIISDYTDLVIEICGVCTDICVVSNALILRSIFPQSRIIVDAGCCAGTSDEAHNAALTVMRNCLIDVING